MSSASLGEAPKGWPKGPLQEKPPHQTDINSFNNLMREKILKNKELRRGFLAESTGAYF